MKANRVFASDKLNLIAALAYATAGCALCGWVMPRSAATVPSLMILLGLPLAFRLVPRNYLYGMRSPRTLWTTEETWYRQNVITGIVMIAAGIAWLATLGMKW
jgi:hypothetical protein